VQHHHHHHHHRRHADHFRPRVVPVFLPPLIPLPVFVPWAPAPVDVYRPAYVEAVPVQSAAPIAVSVYSGSFGANLPLELAVEEARRTQPQELVEFLQRTADSSGGTRACRFSATGMRAGYDGEPIPYQYWIATPASVAASGGSATIYWVQLSARTQRGEERCLAYRVSVPSNQAAEPARDSVEDVLSSLAALGARPDLPAQPIVRTVQLDPRRPVDLVDLL
jgi:hypothetical protein